MADQILNIHFEVTKGERKYVFCVPVGSPLGECYDAAHEVLQKISEMSNEAVQNAKQAETPELVESKA